MSNYWMAPYRLSKEILVDEQDEPRLTQYQFSNLLSKVRQHMMNDAKIHVEKHRLRNPSIYLWDKRETNGDYIIGWYIGNELDLTELMRKEGFKIFEKIEVQTSVRSVWKRLKDTIHKLTTGEGPDPKTLNPY